MKILWTGLGFIAIAEFIALCVSFLNPKKGKTVSGNSDNIIEAGTIDSFQPESVTAFVRGKFYLVCLKDGGFLALSSKCTHLGCSVPWNEEEKKFICPCHASQFDMTGKVLSSPAPRALDIYKIKIVNMNIIVDISRIIKRAGFAKEQVIYPENVKR